MSYLVMECHPGYVILLDEEGRFLKAANLRYETGQTVYDPVLMKGTPEKKRHTVRWISSGIAAIAACFLLFFGIGYYQNYIQPYSSIYLTINPEVQMDLNRQGTVVGLTGANEDGETLLEGYDGKGKDKITVADELIDRAIEMGFLSEGGQVSFSIDSPDDVLFREYGTELRTGVTEYLDGRLTVVIEIVSYQDAQDAGAQREEQPDVSEPEEPAAPAETDYDPGSGAVSDTPPADEGDSPYHGGGGSGNTSRPAKPSVPADTDYGSGSDGVTDYANGNTDYDPGNSGGGDSGGGDSGYDGGRDDDGGDDDNDENEDDDGDSGDDDEADDDD